MRGTKEHFNPFWRLKRKAEWARAVRFGLTKVLERAEEMLLDWGLERHQYEFVVAPEPGVNVEAFEAAPPDQARFAARIVFTIRAPGYAPTSVSCDRDGNLTSQGRPVHGPEDLWTAVGRNELPSGRFSR